MSRDYRSREGLSGSRLGLLARSPAHYRYGIDNPGDPSEAMRFGSLVHSLLLEPHLFASQYMVMPEGMRRDARSKDYQAFLTAANGRELVKAEDQREAQAMVSAVRASEQAQPIFEAKGENEKELFWTEQGVLCKGKLDRYLSELYVVCDYKSTVDASKDKFYWKATELGYLLQLAHYQAGIKALTGCDAYPGVLIVAQESDAPHVVQVYEVPQQLINEAHERRSQLLEVYKQCVESGQWPGYSREMMRLER